MIFIINKIKTNKKICNIIILLSFFLFSILNLIIFLKFHSLFMMHDDDMQFHWHRIAELLGDKQIFPRYSSDSFSYNGSAVMTMYPYLLLYPFVVAFKLVKSVFLCTLIMYLINTLLTLIICFYSSIKFSHNILISYLFAIMYGISPYLFICSFQIYDLGVVYSYIFMPLIVFGFIYLIHFNRWVMLSIGMTLTIYSNILMSVIISFLLFIWLFLSINKLNYYKIVNLIKASFVTVMSTSLFWLPAFKLLISNKIRNPSFSRIIPMGLKLLQTPSNATAPVEFLTIYSIIAIIMGAIFFKIFNKVIKRLYVFSLIILIISSRLFPWHLLNNTFIRTIQYTGRFVLFPQLILTYILAVGIVYMFSFISLRKILLLIITFLFVIFLIQFLCQNSYVHDTFTQFNGKYSNNKIAMNNLIQDNSKIDYYPNRSIPITKYILYDKSFYYFREHKHLIKFLPKGNGKFIFYIPRNVRCLSIPFLYYHGTKYTCYVNGKYTNVYPNKYQVVTMNKKIYKGYNYINIRNSTNNYVLYSDICTIIGVLIYIKILINVLMKRRGITK